MRAEVVALAVAVLLLLFASQKLMAARAVLPV